MSYQTVKTRRNFKCISLSERCACCLRQTLCNPVGYSPLGSSLRGTPGKDAGVGCRFLLQGIFLTQESDPGLLRCRQVPYHRAAWEAWRPFAVRTVPVAFRGLGVHNRALLVETPSPACFACGSTGLRPGNCFLDFHSSFKFKL